MLLKEFVYMKEGAEVVKRHLMRADGQLETIDQALKTESQD